MGLTGEVTESFVGTNTLIREDEGVVVVVVLVCEGDVFFGGDSDGGGGGDEGDGSGEIVFSSPPTVYLSLLST